MKCSWIARPSLNPTVYCSALKYILTASFTVEYSQFIMHEELTECKKTNWNPNTDGQIKPFSHILFLCWPERLSEICSSPGCCCLYMIYSWLPVWAGSSAGSLFKNSSECRLPGLRGLDRLCLILPPDNPSLFGDLFFLFVLAGIMRAWRSPANKGCVVHTAQVEEDGRGPRDEVNAGSQVCQKQELCGFNEAAFCALRLCTVWILPLSQISVNSEAHYGEGAEYTGRLCVALASGHRGGQLWFVLKRPRCFQEKWLGFSTGECWRF